MIVRAWWRLHQAWFFVRFLVFAAPALWAVCYTAPDADYVTVEVGSHGCWDNALDRATAWRDGRVVRS